MEPILAGADSWLGILGSVGMLLLTHAANKYVLPFLKVGKRKRYAELIATIADEITDDLMARYPEKEWLRHLDEAVDALMAVCDIAPEIARRAIRAAMRRRSEAAAEATAP